MTFADGLLVSSWVFTFWICATCSFTSAVSISICCCRCAMRYLQLLNFEIEHGLFGGVGNGLGPDAFGRQSTRAWTFGGNRAQSPIGIDHHHSGRSCGNRCTVDIVDKAPVTFLPKNTVHTRVMADDDIVIGDGNTRPGHLCLRIRGRSWFRCS